MKKGELYPPPFLGPSTHLEKATLEPLYNETAMDIHFQVGVGKGWGWEGMGVFVLMRCSKSYSWKDKISGLFNLYSLIELYFYSLSLDRIVSLLLISE